MIQGHLIEQTILIKSYEEAKELWSLNCYGYNLLSKGEPQPHPSSHSQSSYGLSLNSLSLHSLCEELYSVSLVEAYYLLKYTPHLFELKHHSLASAYQAFCTLQGTFQVDWLVYESLKQASWIVKNGSKYGVQHLLYTENPGQGHSIYGVLLEEEQGPSWHHLVSVIRTLDQVKKKLMVCSVEHPQGRALKDAPVKPSVRRIHVSRWLPQAHRE